MRKKCSKHSIYILEKDQLNTPKEVRNKGIIKKQKSTPKETSEQNNHKGNKIQSWFLASFKQSLSSEVDVFVGQISIFLEAIPKDKT